MTFDTEQKVNDILQEEYAFDAYEENLDVCVENAQDIATDIYSSLHDNFSNEADEFLAEIEKILVCLEKALQFTAKWKAERINPEIDNTN